MELFNNNIFISGVAGFIIVSTAFFAYAIFRLIDAEKEYRHYESLKDDEGDDDE